jgi:7,8-dihydroneopterin aldolase/epimerase/oxygenase
MESKQYILLNDAKFFAYHGAIDQEHIVGHLYIVNICLGVDFSKAIEHDSLEDTIDYTDVYTRVKEEMNRPSLLLEHVAGQIIKRLHNDFPNVLSIELKIEKMNPPITGCDMRSAGVKVCWQL